MAPATLVNVCGVRLPEPDRKAAMSGGLIIGAGQAERVRSPLGGDVTYLVRGGQTGGTFTALEFLVPPGEGPPLHVHTREEEWVYLLEGQLRWKLGDELSTESTGASLFIPRGAAHGFHNATDKPARMVATFTPAGIEGFFDRLADLKAFDLEAFRAAAAAHRMEVLGPRLAESDPL